MKKLHMYSIYTVMLLLFLFVPTVEASSQLIPLVEKKLGSENVSVTIKSGKTGENILDYKGSIPRQPASNMKLLSGYAALKLLGENYRFKTEVYTDGEVVNQTLKGNVYLKGYGDPTFMYTHLKMIGNALKSKGITKIEGNILGDDTYFEGPLLPPGVLQSEESYYYAAKTSALSLSPNEDFDVGTLIVQVSPAKLGQKVTYKVTPHIGNMKVINNSRTVSRGGKNTLSIRRTYNTNEIIISGQLPVGRSAKEWVTVNDPTVTTLAIARAAFQHVGIELGKGSWYWRQGVKENHQLIHTHYSRTLKAMFPQFMKLSNNSMADIFVKTIGAQYEGNGDLQTGLRVVSNDLQGNGLYLDAMQLIDGSGLSSKNRVTTNQLATLLSESRQTEVFLTFYKSLPVGGNSNRMIGGTLKNRFTGKYANYVVAKTGYIDGVYSLSGFVKTRSGNEYIVSIIANNSSSSKISPIDSFVKALIDYY